jgi:hypothetical protein
MAAFTSNLHRKHAAEKDDVGLQVDRSIECRARKPERACRLRQHRLNRRQGWRSQRSALLGIEGPRDRAEKSFGKELAQTPIPASYLRADDPFPKPAGN